MRHIVRRPLRTLLPAALAVFAIGAAGCSSGSDAPGDSGSERSPSPSRDAALPEDEAKVSAVALPAVAQPGKQPAPSSADSGVVVARVQPAEPGAAVRLERRDGDDWRPVDEVEQDRTGFATFADLPGVDGAVRYRAVAASGGGSSSATVEAGAWRSVFADEFDGTSLDEGSWSYRQLGIYNPDGGRECSKSDESAVRVADGTLRLQVRQDPARAGERCVTEKNGTHDYYLNGHVSTLGKFDFTYGVAAARVKFQEGRGQHGAFWMQRGGVTVTPGDAASSGAEIDVAEYFGEGYPNGGLASFAYYLNEDNEDEKLGGVHRNATQQLPQGDDWWRSYHVFSVEWTPEEYVFRVDGREIHRVDRGISGVDQFLVLSLLSSDWELGKLDPSTLPSEMDVDWVRVWQPADA